MSDYTDFTYLDYQYSDAGQRQADSDAITREFSKCGASYYGNGSEFIVGYDANGGAMVDSDAVRAAARRKAEEAESSRRAEEALMRLIAKNASAHRASTYLELDREIVWFPWRGKVNGMQLVHRSGMNCRYAFSPVHVGPFPTYMHGLGEINEIRVDKTYPCPFCFAGTPIMDDLEQRDSERVRSIKRALQKNQWREECYMSGADSEPSVTNNVQLEESRLFSPYAAFVTSMGANPDMDGVVMLDAAIERLELDEGGDYIRAKFVCVSKMRPPNELGSVLAQLSLFRYKKDATLEEFRKVAKKVVSNDFEMVYSDLHLFNAWAQDITEFDGGCSFVLVGGLIPKNMPQVADGVYMVCLDVGGARMYKDAKFGVYEFRREAEDSVERTAVPQHYVYLDHHYTERAQRRVDLDAVRREYAQGGMTYYGDGSEFIAPGGGAGAALDMDTVRAAVKRDARFAAEAQEAFEQFRRTLAQQETKSGGVGLDASAVDICAPTSLGSLLAWGLLHRADANCPYDISPRRLGQFADLDAVLDRIIEAQPDNWYFAPCPFCLGDACFTAGWEATDAISLDAIRHSLRENRWRSQCYFPKGAERSDQFNNPQIEEPRYFKPFVPYVSKYGADSGIQRVVILSSDLFRHATQDYRHCIHARLLIRDPEEAPDEFKNIPAQLTMRRFKKDIPFETFQKNADSFTAEDFEEVESSQCLTTLRVDASHCETLDDGRGSIYFVELDYELGELDLIEDGIYAIELEIGGARMYRAAKWGVYGFYQ